LLPRQSRTEIALMTGIKIEAQNLYAVFVPSGFPCGGGKLISFALTSVSY